MPSTDTIRDLILDGYEISIRWWVSLNFGVMSRKTDFVYSARVVADEQT